MTNPCRSSEGSTASEDSSPDPFVMDSFVPSSSEGNDESHPREAEGESQPLVSSQVGLRYSDSFPSVPSLASSWDGEGEEDVVPFLPPSGNFDTADEYVDCLREQLGDSDFTEMGRRQRKFTEEAVAFYDDRKHRHTWLSLILQGIAGVLEGISSGSHIHSEKTGLQMFVGVDWLRKAMWYPALGFTVTAHTADSLEATDRLILKMKDHREFWDQIIGFLPKFLITIAALFIVFSATIGEANKTWRENAGEIIALQLFWTIYNTLIHLPMKIWGTIDFLNVFVNKLLYKHILGTNRATSEQVELLASWVESMSEQDLLSGVAFDRSQWPTKPPQSVRTKIMWMTISVFAFTLSGVLLLLSTIIKTESSQEGLHEFVGYAGSIIIAVVGQLAAVSLSAKWPYRTIMKPFELLKTREESGEWARVHYPRAFGGVYSVFLFISCFACFSSFYSATNILKLPGFLEWSYPVFVYVYGIHYILYAACAGFDFSCRCAQYVLEMNYFDEPRIRTLRQATKSSLTNFAIVEDFDLANNPDSGLKKTLNL